MRSIVSKLSEVDQFIFDAELRHIETLKRLIEEVEVKKLERKSKKWAKMSEVSVGGVTA